MLLSGEPFDGLIMFWNWIGRSQEEIVQARGTGWQGHGLGR
jgi:quercetin 2,3-dioxygenase